MLIETERKKLNLNKCFIREDISDWVEQDIIVPDNKPDAIKIINVTVNPYVSNYQLMDDKIKIEGKLNYYIIYKSNDTEMQTRGLFTSFQYSQVLELKGATKDMNASIKAYVRNVIYSLPNERKIATKTEIIFRVRLDNNMPVSLISNFKDSTDIECKTSVEKFNNIIATKKSIIASKEDIMLPRENEDFYEILKAVPVISKTEYKESYNKIMVKGDIEISMLYLTNNRNSPVKNVNLEVPFTGMIELDSMNDKSKYDISYSLQDFNINLNQEITTSRTFTVDYQVEANLTMYEPEDIEYISDFYSQTRDLKYNINNIDIVKNMVNINKEIDLNETVSNVLNDDIILLSYGIDISNVLSRVVGNTVHIEGNAKLTLLLMNKKTDDVESKLVDMLVNEEYTIEDINQKSNVNVNIDLLSSNVSQSSNDVDVKIKLNAIIIVEDIYNINVIDNINDSNLNTNDLDSMNIYIVKVNDTLWNIAKKYKTSVEKIVKINDIADIDNIAVGQKILIIR